MASKKAIKPARTVVLAPLRLIERDEPQNRDDRGSFAGSFAVRPASKSGTARGHGLNLPLLGSAGCF